MIRYTTKGRAQLYNDAFPSRPPIAEGNGMVSGCWMIGACYKNPNPLYGAYPHGYLERVHAMFPEARKILHVFSGGLTQMAACEAAWPNVKEANAANEARTGTKWNVVSLGDGWAMELVDMHGPEQGRNPTWQGDLFDFCELPEQQGRFDLVLADPPYSAADAVKYDCPAPNRGKILRALRQVTAKAGNLVWLDQVWPMHRKADWKTWGTIGLVRSTNHRMRLVSMFEAQ